MRVTKLVLLLTTLAILGGCAIVPAEEMKVKSTMLTSGGEGPRYKRIPQKKFTQADLIIFIVTMEWADIEKSAGSHEVRWKWYNNDKLVTIVKRRYEFFTTPFELWSNFSGNSLGVGNNKVEFYIGDKLISSDTFSVE